MNHTTIIKVTHQFSKRNDQITLNTTVKLHCPGVQASPKVKHTPYPIPP